MGRVLYKVLFGDYAGFIGTIAIHNPGSHMVWFYPLNQTGRFYVHIKQIGRLDAEVYYD